MALFGMIYYGIFDLLVTRPFDTALQLAHDSSAQAAPLVAAYFVGIYLVARVTFVLTRRPIAAWASRRFQGWRPTSLEAREQRV